MGLRSDVEGSVEVLDICNNLSNTADLIRPSHKQHHTRITHGGAVVLQTLTCDATKSKSVARCEHSGGGIEVKKYAVPGRRRSG